MQMQWIAAQVYLKQSGPSAGNLQAMGFKYRRMTSGCFRHAKDVSLQTGQFRVEWQLATKNIALCC